jgi:MFS family permease
VFLTGLALFTAASAACGLATGPAWLLTARAVQGAGGALTSAVVLSMIARLYDEESARSRAFALLAFVGSAGGSIGVVAGGVLTDLASWRWVFWVNVPLGVVVLAAGALVLVRESAPGLAAGLGAGRALVPAS